MKSNTIHIYNLLFVIFLFGINGCSEDSLFSSRNKREEIHSRFMAQKELAIKRRSQLFDVFNTSLTRHEQEGLEFIYAYMPLCDLSIHNGDFFLRQVRSSLQAREFFPWGKSIPDDIFLHYVMPVRVNNEYLDSGRVIFFDELKERLEGLSLSESALEVNHWCHQKVTYHSTDEYRTSSPLSTVKTAYGRCGEQSTFTVAAMRAVCIPARQVYTPRWAHTNDNHAWVEVWIDGAWHFLGAGEPEPELDRGWFIEPASRAMLIHSKVYGSYTDNEEVLKKSDEYTEVNILPSYAVPKTVFVKVINEFNQPVSGATVEFQLVNFSEFFSLAKLITNTNGICRLTTGKGDLMVWASDHQKIAYAKIGAETGDSLILVLKDEGLQGVSEELVIQAPVGRDISSEREKNQNNLNERLFYEDSVRAAYENTFIDSVSVVDLSFSLGIDDSMMWQKMKESRGNWKELRDFFEYTGTLKEGRAMALLSVISSKDLRDTPFKVFKDHFEFSIDSFDYDRSLFNQYVLNPRINNEMISDYKGTIRAYFGEHRLAEMISDIDLLIQWVRDSIQVVENANDWKVPVLPVGVLQLRLADANSRDIFFVASARSLGIAARIDLVRKQPQVYLSGKWMDVNIEKALVEEPANGMLNIYHTPSSNNLLLPEYYKHFTIARFLDSGFITLDYNDSTTFRSFPARLNMDEGLYSLVTSTRLSDGSVKVFREFFEIKKGRHSEIFLKIPDVKMSTSLSTSLSEYALELNVEFRQLTPGKKINIASLQSEKGLILIWINPGLEPTKHLLNDLVRLNAHFEKRSGNMVFLIKPDHLTPGFNPGNITGIPHRSISVIDDINWLEKLTEKSGVKSNSKLPVVFVVDESNKVLFHSKGYRIGIGDDILKQLLVH